MLGSKHEIISHASFYPLVNTYHLFAPLADTRAAAVNYRNWQIQHSSTPSVINAGRGKRQR